jgi:hypothetical protein
VHAVEQGRYLPLSEMRTIAELEEWWRDNSTDSRSAACQVMPILNSAHACRGMAVRSFEG